MGTTLTKEPREKTKNLPLCEIINSRFLKEE